MRSLHSDLYHTTHESSLIYKSDNSNLELTYLHINQSTIFARDPALFIWYGIPSVFQSCDSFFTFF